MYIIAIALIICNAVEELLITNYILKMFVTWPHYIELPLLISSGS